LPHFKWSYFLLILWVALFLTALYVVPEVTFYYSVAISLFNAMAVLAITYIIAGIRRRRLSSKFLAILVILLIAGFLYQSRASLNESSLKTTFSDEANFLSSIPSSLEALSATSPTTTFATTAGGPSTQTETTSLSQAATSVSQSPSQSSTLATSTQNTAENANWVPSNPSISNDNATISYPPNYDTLVDYALALINSDREQAGLPAVTLSSVPSGQQHADSMDYFGYFSHWDTQGYKPYMRYSLLGGTGAMSENIGLTYCTDSSPSSTLLTLAPCNLQTIENGISSSEWSMMNNDAVCCSNGHRDNILDPLHNEVSIGIAYNSTTSALYFVEDFQNDYITLSSPIVNPGNQIVVVGSMTTEEDVSQITVYYDALPQAMTTSQLDSTSAYGPGTFVGGVFPPCSNGCEYYPRAVTVYASSWQVSSTSISIDFSLNNFIQADGPGVYTIYVQTGSSTGDSILTHSIFMTS